MLKRRGDLLLVCGENDEKNRNSLLTSFWSNIWVGSIPLMVPFYMHSLSQNIKIRVWEMFFIQWEVIFFGIFHQKRYFSVWEEDLLFNLHQILQGIRLSMVSDYQWWKFGKDEVHSVSSTYNALLDTFLSMFISSSLLVDVILPLIWVSWAPLKVVFFLGQSFQKSFPRERIWLSVVFCSILLVLFVGLMMSFQSQFLKKKSINCEVVVVLWYRNFRWFE